MALSGCNAIKTIKIPKSLTTIEQGALSFMSSLTKIEVDPGNPTYLTEDNLSLIDQDKNIFIQYAINAKKRDYWVKPIKRGYGEIETTEEIYGISEFAFGGAKYLEKLSINSATDFIGGDSFKNCPRLRTLTIKHAPAYEQHMITVNKRSIDSIPSFPFEEVIINDLIESIHSESYTDFKKIKKVRLPQTIKKIDLKAFKGCRLLEEVLISNTIETIEPVAFNDDTLLVFENGLKFLGRDFEMLHTKDKSKIYALKDGTLSFG